MFGGWNSIMFVCYLICSDAGDVVAAGKYVELYLFWMAMSLLFRIILITDGGVAKMLYIYDDKDDLPKDKKFIHDVEAWFSMPTETNQYIDAILHDIEKGRYYDAVTYVDRFGVNLYCNFMSTGAKAAVLVASQQDCVIDCIEVGYNVLECLIVNKIPGNIFVDAITRITALECYFDETEITYKNIVFKCVDHLNFYVKKGRLYED